MRPFAVLLFVYLTRLTCALYHDNCTIDDTQACDYASLDGPTMIYPGGDTGCVFVDEGIPYSFQVNPGIGEDANNVILHFQGGGACVSEDCPRGSVLRKPVVRGDGMFADRPDNALRGWTKVIVSYCSGDAHIGNHLGGNGTLRFSGRNNTKAALGWFYANVPAPDRLLLTGCSAGSAGAQYWSHSILNAFRDTDTVVSVVYDSWVGSALNVDAINSDIVDLWNYCSETDFGWTLYEYEACMNYNWTISDMQKMTHASHKDIPFLFSAFKLDLVILQGQCTWLGLSRCSQKDLYLSDRQLLRSYVEVDTENNNVITAFFNEEEHCILPRPVLYEYLGGTIAPALAEIANRDPASTSLDSYCVVPWWNPWWSSLFDYGCDSVLRNAVFRP